MEFGILHLPTGPGPVPPELWAELGVNRILVVLMLAAALLVLKDYFRLLPLLGGCLVRSRGNMEIEHSVSQARNRGRCAVVGMGILALLADRYGLCRADFMSDIAPQWTAAALFGLLAAYLLLRGLLNVLIGKRRLDSESRAASFRALYNYFLAVLPLMLLSVGLLALFGASDSVVRAVILSEIIASLLLTFVRKWQIFRSAYSALQTFLYLCGLELLPLAALIVPAAVL